TNKNLGGYLKEKEVGELYIVGLTAEYCVKSTVLDALKYGFKTIVIKDAVEGIRQNENDFDNAFEEMKNAGAIIITSEDVDC
ncbi:MAG: isochorismatase family protein, partial [Ignavibacteria bacterium]|nr:isochorismatase family protein [Ignavibacteria bacterium]